MVPKRHDLFTASDRIGEATPLKFFLEAAQIARQAVVWDFTRYGFAVGPEFRNR